jgi:hypothetical protein
MTETIRFFLFAVTFTVALFGMALILTGCAVEGAGFENSGRHAKPVVCREIRPGYTQCRSE